MAEHPEVVYWLTLINQSGLKLNIIKPIIQRWCVTQERSLADLFELTPQDLVGDLGLSEADAKQVVLANNQLAGQAKQLQQWREQGLEVLTLTDTRYPQRLLQALPPVVQPLLLWTRGPLDLLNEPGIAILGSDTPDEETLTLVEELIPTLLAAEIHLVSGYGRGLDRTTFEMVIGEESGRAVVLLPMGITAFAKTTDKLEQPVAEGRIVQVSPFAPEMKFNEKFLEPRNMLIDHLALSLLVLDPDEEAQERATAAIERNVPVLVDMIHRENNTPLLEHGALLLTDLGEVIDLVQQAMLVEAESAEIAQTQVEAAPPPPPTEPLIGDTDDDYSLTTEEVEPIDSDEALEILSLGGAVPDILRQRLEDKEDDE